MTYLEKRRELKLSGPQAKEKKIYIIPKRSKKAIAEQKVYSPFVDEYLSRPENQHCAIRWEGCTGKATCVNHLRRRFKKTKMNEDCIEPSCAWCNGQIEIQDARARSEGHLLSKFN